MSVDIVEAEVIEEMTREEAEKITDRIKLKLVTAAQAWSSLAKLVVDAYSRRAHLALGFETWEAYVSAKFPDAGHDLPAPIRQELVAVLSDSGLSTRAIAPVVAVSQKTVVKDLQSKVIPPVSPAADSEISAGPHSVVGLDGKTYQRPLAPASQPERKPRRRPLPHQFRTATDDLDRVLRRLVKLAGDDRVDANRDTLAHKAKLIRRAAEELLKVADLLDPQ